MAQDQLIGTGDAARTDASLSPWNVKIPGRGNELAKILTFADLGAMRTKTIMPQGIFSICNTTGRQAGIAASNQRAEGKQDWPSSHG